VTNIVFSDSAKHLARTRIAAMPAYDEPTQAIVAVHWSSGVRDNRRGVEGEVVWDVIEPPGWKCHVAPWLETADNPIERHTCDIDGLRVLIVGLESAANSTLFVDTIQGEFTVEHRAI